MRHKPNNDGVAIHREQAVPPAETEPEISFHNGSALTLQRTTVADTSTFPLPVIAPPVMAMFTFPPLAAPIPRALMVPLMSADPAVMLMRPPA